MKTLTTALALASTFALAGVASAQDASTLTPDTNFTFEDDLVNGDLVRPDGDRIFGRIRGQRVSLIRPRSHYVPELVKSVETI